MHWSLRQWLDEASKLGEVRELNGCHWDLEIGAVTDLAQCRKDGPAVLFNNITGYPSGYRILTNSLGTLRRFALTLGFPLDITEREFVAEWRARLQGLQPVNPLEANDGPVFENKMIGDQVDLFKFPVPRWHHLDKNRYIGVAHDVVTRDPDTGIINLGCYRVEVIDKNHVLSYMIPGKHGNIHRQKYFEQGLPCPVAIVIGPSPLGFLAGGTVVPAGFDEYQFIGALQGEPVPVVKAPITGLPVPADAEIVLEGEISPTEIGVEGPFGEWMGYYGAANEEPVITIKAVYHRNNPMILGCPPCKPPSEDSRTVRLLRSASVEDALEKAGVPDITGVWYHEAGGGRLLMVIGLKQRYPGHTKQAAMAALGSKAGAFMGRYIILVDDDIDITDINDVLWAMATRSDPERSIEIIRECWSSTMDPAIPPEQKGLNSRAIIDACRPYKWKDTFPLTCEASPELRQQVLSKWGPLLFE